ncbi:MAG TPA: adenylate/guanylate cyclase domain-containing protein [Candidatus Wallbacteria bacterium]|nr:MAG: Adenylate cyclase 1 [bacterium ADurb.Bin243]HPG57105.1 adenylate/guanylate cyclase domain-containing protein [Candidatus Wallbacteria bacterium]
MKILQAYKKLYIGLYLCFILSIAAADMPLQLFESYSLIDSKSIKSIIDQIALKQKEKIDKSGARTFGMIINERVRYELPIPSGGEIQKTAATAETQLKPVESGGVRITGNPLIDSNNYAFKLSTSRGLVDVLISGRENGSFSISFVRNFEKVAVEKNPFLLFFGRRFVTLLLCVILALHLLPLYKYNFSGRAADEKYIEKKIIGLPLFILGLVWTDGLIKFALNLTGCYSVLGEIPATVFTLFLVSLIMFAALTSLLTMGFTQEYINKYIAAPFFEKNGPYDIRNGSSINLSARFFIIIFSIGIAPTAIGLYLPLSFNTGLLSGMSSVYDVLNNFDMLVPTLITAFFAMYFFTMQIASMFSFRKNIIIPVNKLIERMKLVARGDFKCKSSVLYVDEIGQLKGHFNSMLDGLAEREKIKDTFGRFISIEIAEKLLKEKKVDLMGEEIEATILFSDIRDFTPLSEKLSAPELIDFLNLYFSHIVKPIHSHGGVVNKFIGDAVMAVFAPAFGNLKHEEAAVAAAIDIKNALVEFNALGKYPPVKSGVGIHRGKLVAGNVGTEERMEYTFIGDNVNIASRIESETKNFQTDILMSEDVVNKLENGKFKDIEIFKVGPVMMKGKSVPLSLYGIKKIKGYF